jgi:hypothetical protein
MGQGLGKEASARFAVNFNLRGIGSAACQVADDVTHTLMVEVNRYRARDDEDGHSFPHGQGFGTVDFVTIPIQKSHREWLKQRAVSTHSNRRGERGLVPAMVSVAAEENTHERYSVEVSICKVRRGKLRGFPRADLT